MNGYWLKQGKEPLFADIEWNKPERRDQAGRLLIIGGSQHALNAPAESYNLVQKEGVGHITVALPDKTKRLVGPALPEAIYLPSTKSGELSQDGEEELLYHALHTDGMLLPGDFGRNSQTTILLEHLLKNFQGLAVVSRDAVDALAHNPQILIDRPDTTVVASFAQAQKLLKPFGIALAFTMDLVQLTEALHKLTAEKPAAVVTLHHDQLVVAAGGQVSTTTCADGLAHWRLPYASLAACYQLWNPRKPFEALSYAGFRSTNDHV